MARRAKDIKAIVQYAQNRGFTPGLSAWPFIFFHKPGVLHSTKVHIDEIRLEYNPKNVGKK